ncbi:MAG: DM13 domain-containing protein [Anderseniella sp.]
MLKSTALTVALLVVTAVPSMAASSTFKGASGHKTSGSVTVTEQGGRIVIKLGSNFNLDGAPDPYVTLGNGSRPVKGGTAGILARNKGSGTYSVPATTTTKAAKEVVIWCKKYSVPLGVARLK